MRVEEKFGGRWESVQRQWRMPNGSGAKLVPAETNASVLCGRLVIAKRGDMRQ